MYCIAGIAGSHIALLVLQPAFGFHGPLPGAKWLSILNLWKAAVLTRCNGQRPATVQKDPSERDLLLAS